MFDFISSITWRETIFGFYLLMIFVTYLIAVRPFTKLDKKEVSRTIVEDSPEIAERKLASVYVLMCLLWPITFFGFISAIICSKIDEDEN